ncbi:hypothetical protein UNSWDHB_2869 [Dehalobacter sp. UNSWDHB]|nr:hypothetical protein DHBDCA_p740 [Dehalobacter sp. DCA]EQB19854.1 hypothetical protein UNSWDHB_2869 [Dehalobacter sp. UNSWDHB]
MNPSGNIPYIPLTCASNSNLTCQQKVTLYVFNHYLLNFLTSV